MGIDRRKGATIAIVLALLVGLLASLFWSDRISAKQRDDREDLNLFLDASSAGWAEVTRQFFEAPESSALTIGSLLPQMEDRQDRIALLAEIVRIAPNLDSAFIGYPNGEFLFVGRSDDAAPGGFRTRMISLDGDVRRVDLTWTDASVRVIREELDVVDTFDPRQRPWYVPIATGQERNWTGPYVFSSSQQPGITHSVRVVEPSGDLHAVVGVDIQLKEVSDFLDQLSPGGNGEALVVDNLGRVIASSPMQDFAEGDRVRQIPLVESQELMDLIEAATGEESVRGPSPDGRRTTVVRAAGVRDEWYLAVRALDDDFIDDETASNAFETFAVGVTAAVAAGLLGLGVLRYLVGLKEEADVDELTNVSSRRAIRRALRSSLDRSKTPVYVAIVDLDDFKAINDSHGHAAGDAALRTAAAVIDRFAVASSAHAGRLGGDEFLLFGEGAEPSWQQLIDLIEADSDALSASIGVSVSLSEPHDEMDRIFSAADALLFEAKKAGRGTFCRAIHTPGSSSATIE